MQRTDESRGAYGEDPYGDAGHAYAYGYEYGGSVGTDTSTMSWDSVELAQWTHSEYSTHATGTDPHATGTHPYVAGPYPATTAWDSPHGDVLTVPPPEFDTGAPVPEPETPANESVRPVFVDSSGRRRRRVLRAARLLVIPAGGYVGLLISTMLGGPGIGSPFVPQPDSTSHRPVGCLHRSRGHVRAHRSAHQDHVPDLDRRSRPHLHPHPQGSCQRFVPPSREVIQGLDVTDRRRRNAPARRRNRTCRITPRTHWLLLSVRVPPGRRTPRPAVEPAADDLRQPALYDGLPQPSPYPGFRQPGPSKTPQLY
ncbi:hypothetical protein [Streptomyces mirabilis]|uniref:hypothetical protein n=1 Tax=Streptomyces mirabilis TaxID=68239 RepID=UPI0034351881